MYLVPSALRQCQQTSIFPSRNLWRLDGSSSGLRIRQPTRKVSTYIFDYQAECDSLSLESAEKAHQVFRNEVRKEITVLALEFSEKANENTIQDLLTYCLDEAKLHQRNRTFTRKAGTKTVVFANNFANFLQAYSGVVEIMKGADQQYGGIAYGTLSILLIVCKLVHF